MTRIASEQLSPEAFAPFGRIVDLPREEAQAYGPGWRWWGETALLRGDGRSWGIGYLDLAPAELRFDWAERHLRTQEAIFATSVDLLVYVAPADHPDDAARLDSLQSFRAFRVPAGRGVVLDTAVWHGAPFTLGETTAAFVLILEGTGSEDVTVVRFPESPIDVEVNQE